MQTELEDAGYTNIQIIGVNAEGYESGNEDVCDGRDLPWLQDTTDEEVWDLWDVTYRDVIILDGNNEVYAVYNLSTYGLSSSSNYDALMDLFVAAESEL